LFDEARDSTSSLKENKKSIKDQLRVIDQRIQPIRDRHSQIIHEVERSRAKTKELEKTMQTTNKNFKLGTEKAEKYQEEIDSVYCGLNSLDTNHRKAQARVAECRAKLQQTESLERDYPPVADLTRTLQEAKDESHKMRRRVLDAKRVIEANQS